MAARIPRARENPHRTIPASRWFPDSSFPLNVIVRDQFDLEMHRHDFTEIVVVLDGVGDHLFDEQVYPICAGDVYAIDKSHAHGYRNTRGLRIANVLFDEAFVTRRAPWVESLPGYQALVHLEPTLRKKQAFGGKLRLAPEAMARAGDQVRRLLGEMQERGDGWRAMAFALFMELLVELSRWYTGSGERQMRDVADVGRVISYLENHYDRPTELADLEKLVGRSTRTLLRRFNQATGLTPMQYLLRVRVARSCGLLAGGSLSITEIAGRVGFDDSNYFARQFRQVMGMSPSEYRRNTTAPV
jgi:AraC-like DNA-binding protein